MIDEKHIISNHLQFWSKAAPSDVGLRVAALLDVWQGLHHFDSQQMKKVDWSNNLYIELKLSRHTSIGQLSTFDFSDLTRLVFLCHDHCIRCSIKPCNPQFMCLIFHPRNSREGDSSIRHPTIERAVEQWREKHAMAAFEEKLAGIH